MTRVYLAEWSAFHRVQCAASCAVCVNTKPCKDYWLEELLSIEILWFLFLLLLSFVNLQSGDSVLLLLWQHNTNLYIYIYKNKKIKQTRAPQYHFRAGLLLQQTKQWALVLVCEGATVHRDWYTRDKTLFDSWIRLQSHALCDALATRYLCHTRPALLIRAAEPVISNTSGRVSSWINELLLQNLCLQYWGAWHTKNPSCTVL